MPARSQARSRRRAPIVRLVRANLFDIEKIVIAACVLGIDGVSDGVGFGIVLVKDGAQEFQAFLVVELVVGQVSDITDVDNVVFMDIGHFGIAVDCLVFGGKRAHERLLARIEILLNGIDINGLEHFDIRKQLVIAELFAFRGGRAHTLECLFGIWQRRLKQLPKDFPVIVLKPGPADADVYAEATDIASFIEQGSPAQSPSVGVVRIDALKLARRDFLCQPRVSLVGKLRIRADCLGSVGTFGGCRIRRWRVSEAGKTVATAAATTSKQHHGEQRDNRRPRRAWEHPISQNTTLVHIFHFLLPFGCRFRSENPMHPSHRNRGVIYSPKSKYATSKTDFSLASRDHCRLALPSRLFYVGRHARFYCDSPAQAAKIVRKPKSLKPV